MIIWITYSETRSSWASFADAPKQGIDKSIWAGSMARLFLNCTTGQVLKNELVLKDLPRFGPDHENFANYILFGPDGKLYVAQGANTGMGLCDCEKNQEPSRESLLSSAVLCLDLGELPQKLPIDTKTYDGGGSYYPYSQDAPLKIYATGLTMPMTWFGTVMDNYTQPLTALEVMKTSLPQTLNPHITLSPIQILNILGQKVFLP